VNVPEFVFAYGSLLRAGTRLEQPAAPCVLRGYRRGWDVAMDNRRTIPGYKYYMDAVTGERPEVYVTFLNIRRDHGARVNGVVFPVDAATLATLDRRERNYEREDVTELLDGSFDGRVWGYVGTADARRRYETGRGAGTAVVSAQYVRKVRDDFASFGPASLEAFDATTEELGVPVRDLCRVALAGDGRRPRPAAVEGGA
jgi:cation transport regulator ChaC